MRPHPAVRVARALVAAALLACGAAEAAPPRPRLEPDTGSRPSFLTVAGDHLFFIADDGFAGPQIWALDEHGAARRQSLFRPQPGGAPPGEPRAAGGDVIFTAPDGGGLYQTRVGRGPAVARAFAPPDTRITTAASWNGHVYFGVSGSGSLGELWYAGAPGEQARRWRGPGEGQDALTPSLARLFSLPSGVVYSHFGRELDLSRNEYRLLTAPDQPARRLGAPGEPIEGVHDMFATGEDPVWYFASNMGLWRANLDTGEAIQLIDTQAGPVRRVGVPVLSGGRLFFQGHTAETGAELWTSDGAPEGTRLVKDIAPGVSDGGAYYLAPLRGGVCFVAKDNAHGGELWFSDGTEAGTRLVRDLIPGPRSAEPYQLTAWNGHVYFSCYNDTYGEELWRTDGTEEGTELAAEINPGPGSSEPYYITVFQDALYFSATDGVNGFEIWRSRGTPETTEQVTRIRPPASLVRSSSPRELTALGDVVYFTAVLPDRGRVLCASDGSAEGTGPVAYPEGDGAPLNPRGLEIHDGALYHQTGPEEAPQWWRIGAAGGMPEAAAQGPAPTPETLPGAEAAGLRVVPGSPVAFAGGYVCAAYTPEHGIEPWRHDPETGRFDLMGDVFAGPASSAPANFTVSGESVYFTANTPHGGTELFRSGAAPGSVEQVWDLHPTPISSMPDRLHADANGVSALIRSHPEGYLPQGAGRGEQAPHWLAPYVQPGEFAVTSNAEFFVCDTPDTGAELWLSTEGHASAWLVRDLYPNVTP
ncbi:MAG: hypothetical protein KF886_08110 [Candidatus Hydrogenedentes bacterium]|nr:hypothetical protein [Candidatus Hydrogenedentota bacterium]